MDDPIDAAEHDDDSADESRPIDDVAEARRKTAHAAFLIEHIEDQHAADSLSPIYEAAVTLIDDAHDAAAGAELQLADDQHYETLRRKSDTVEGGDR